MQIGGVGVEFARQRWEGDVDDCRVDANDERAKADDYKRGDRVAFAMTNCVEAIEVMYAVFVLMG